MYASASGWAHFRSLFDWTRGVHSERALRVRHAGIVATFEIKSPRALGVCAGRMQSILPKHSQHIPANPGGFTVDTYKIHSLGIF